MVPKRCTPLLSQAKFSDDEIVISGISGRFPESGNMDEFTANLLQGVNMVTVNDRRFRPGLFGIPPGFGCLKEIDKFDAETFGILPGLAAAMDPMLRMTLETTYEALRDVGNYPSEEARKIMIFFASF